MYKAGGEVQTWGHHGNHSRSLSSPPSRESVAPLPQQIAPRPFSPSRPSCIPSEHLGFPSSLHRLPPNKTTEVGSQWVRGGRGVVNVHLLSIPSTDAARPAEFFQHFVFCSRFQHLQFFVSVKYLLWALTPLSPIPRMVAQS